VRTEHSDARRRDGEANGSHDGEANARRRDGEANGDARRMSVLSRPQFVGESSALSAATVP
jgi:hypothetical protein